MKPPQLDFFAPASVAEALGLLGQHGADAKVLAGGQSLLPLLNMRLARPSVLVDLNRIAGLDNIREGPQGLEIGAMARHRAVERSPVVQRLQPLLHAAVRHIGHPQIRNRGTLGGSLAHADPAAELPAVCLALDAEIRAAGPGGSRAIKAQDFFLSYLTTSLESAEILTDVRFPLADGPAGWGFREVSRRHGDFALAGAAVTLTAVGGERCADTRIALFGVGATPLRALAAEQILRGQAISDDILARAAEVAAEEIDEPISDIHASSEFRRHLAKSVVGRALSDAAGRARAQQNQVGTNE